MAAGQRADKVPSPKVGEAWQPSLPGNRQPTRAELEEANAAEEKAAGEKEVKKAAVNAVEEDDEPWEDGVEAEYQEDSYELLAENGVEQDASTIEHGLMQGEDGVELKENGEADVAEAPTEPQQEGESVEQPCKAEEEEEVVEDQADIEEEIDNPEEEYDEEDAEEAEEEEAWFEGEEEEEEAQDELEDQDGGDEEVEELDVGDEQHAAEGREGDNPQEKEEDQSSAGKQKVHKQVQGEAANMEVMDGQWPVLSEAMKGKGKGVVKPDPSATSASKAELQQQLTKLLEENHILKLELGQAKFQIKTLSDLRGKADLALREAAAAKVAEARSRREVQQAREYATKRIDFARNEKAEMLLHTQALERDLSKALDQDAHLKKELKEAIWDRDHAADRLDTVQREVDHWKKECGKQSSQCKQLEARVRQLEHKQSIHAKEAVETDRISSPPKPSQEHGTTLHTNGSSQPGVGAAQKRSASSRRSGPVEPNGKAKHQDADLALLHASRVSSMRRTMWRLMAVTSAMYSFLRRCLRGDADVRIREGSSSRTARGRHASAASAASDKDGDDAFRQQIILLCLVGLIASLVMFKLCT
mmetsp:Transcript_2620/g.6738  ORF Transcript_2620/g.6738 Transcript_2620/m.6738 type:complete len:589 (+) Transcript_2620:98-1864(+)